MEKGGGRKTSRRTPLPKRGFGPPLVRYVFHPPQASELCFCCTKIHARADQKLFWRGRKIFGRARSLVRFPPPIRFAPPHITAQVVSQKSSNCKETSSNCKQKSAQTQLEVKSSIVSRKLPTVSQKAASLLFLFSLGGVLASSGQGKNPGDSVMHRIVVTVLCRLRPPFHEGELPFSCAGKPLFLWEVLLLLQNLRHESTAFPYKEMGG